MLSHWARTRCAPAGMLAWLPCLPGSPLLPRTQSAAGQDQVQSPILSHCHCDASTAVCVRPTSLPSAPSCRLPSIRQAIAAFEEAVAGMRVGGVRRVEVLGELPALSYPRDRSQRFVSGYK